MKFRAILVVLALAACSGSEPRWYAELLDGASFEELDELRAATPYTSIVLVDVQAYLFDSKRLEFHVDGTARRSDADGESKGRVSPFDYARLCLLIERNGLAAMEPRYEASVFHAIDTTITVTRRAGGTIEVGDYGKSGPLELWALIESVRGVASRIRWEPVEAASTPR